MVGRLVCGLVSLTLLVACGGAPMAPAEPMEDMTPEEATNAERVALARCGEVMASGYCGVRFGMTAAEARAVFPVALAGDEGAPGAQAWLRRSTMWRIVVEFRGG